MTSFSFLPHILQPTRITEFSATIIDNIYGNNFNQQTFSGNILIKFADHFTQFLSINKEIVKLIPKAIYKRDFSKFDEKSFIDDMSIQNWEASNFTDTNSTFDDFVWRIEDCVDRHAPFKKLNKKQVKKNSKPWINNDIIKMIRHRDRLFKKFKAVPFNNHIKSIYNLFRNRITREIKKAKNYIIKIILKLT